MTGCQNCDTAVDPTLDEILDVLSSWRRRVVIYHLERTDGEHASIEEVASSLHEHEPRVPGREQVHAYLYHSTLPCLREAGVVEYDSRSGTIRYRPDAIPDRLLESIKAVEGTE